MVADAAAPDTRNSSGSRRVSGRCGRSRRALLSVDCLKASHTSVRPDGHPR